MPNMPTSLRLSAEARYLLEAIQRRTGLKLGAVMEMALRRLADSEGIARPTREQLEEWKEGKPIKTIKPSR